MEPLHDRRTAGGFTLVELLIVVGIVAVLIAILLPALSKARRFSKQIACASQLRQVVLASMQYAADNKNRIPERWRYGSTMTYNSGFSANTQQTWQRFDGSAGFTPLETSSNIGRLAEKGYLSGTWDTANMAATGASIPFLWCPAATPDVTAGNTGNGYLSSYLFNPHTRHNSNFYVNGVLDDCETRYTRIDKIPRNRVLAMDQCFYPDSCFHLNGKGDTAGWNLAFPDSHVAFIESKDAYQYIVTEYSGGSGNGYKSADQISMMVDFLETIAEGGNPLTQSIMGSGSFGPPFYGIRTAPYRITFGANEDPDQLP